MQTSNFKQPFVIAVVIILAVTVIAVGLNSFTGQASWFSNFRRAPQGEAQNPLGVHNGVVNIGGEPTLSIKFHAANSRIESIDGVDWTADFENNGYMPIGIEPGVIHDLYSREGLQNPDLISAKTLKMNAKGQSDKGFLIMTPNGQQRFETDTIYLAVQPNGRLGVYRQEQNGNDAFLVTGDLWIVTDRGNIRVTTEWN